VRRRKKHTAINVAFVVRCNEAHVKDTILAGGFGHFAVRLQKTHDKVTFAIFLFFTFKNPQKSLE
jgi:hypothetical protein